MMPDLPDDDYLALRRILQEGLLVPVFQPIIDIRVRAILGYEALIRGPQGRLHLPDQLFAAAQRSGIALELEHACRNVSLRAFSRLGLVGRLFLNATPACLLEPALQNGETQALLRELGLPPNRIVLELTENQQIADLPGIHEALMHYRGRGFQIAIDDLGEGFANLRMWSELRPEFVKIDKHFIQGIADDRIKYHFVRAMQDLAGICNASLVAEGVERAADFNCIRDMGIACAQGYFIARPAEQPPHHLSLEVFTALNQAQAVTPLPFGAGKLPTARTLSHELPPLSPDATNDCAIARFEADPELYVLPVVDGNKPVGMLNRHSLIDRFARPFRRELYGAKRCDLFMDHAPLIVDAAATIQELALMLALAPKHYLYDGFIVTEHGAYIGVGNSQDLMATITEMQISAARYANPLTQLPGNVPINEHIDRMLDAQQDFVAAYIDIDNFKPFNDHFGYRRGDDLIQALAQLICAAVDERRDFVGHIGGDDFFVVFQSADWESRCWQVVHGFVERVEAMMAPEEQCQGGYMAESRRGDLGFQPLPTLSIGAVRVRSRQYDSHREVAAAASVAKKQAKKASKSQPDRVIGGSVFIERRRAHVDLPSPIGRQLN